MAAANWPHLLARVLYVPGVCAAISREDWLAGVEAASAAAPESEHYWYTPVPTCWPSWAVKP